VEAESSPFSHTFGAKDGKNGYGYTTMAWINCVSVGSWANIWHLSVLPNNLSTRNPAMFLYGGYRRMYACTTNHS